jgi:HEAT repeat protein
MKTKAKGEQKTIWMTATVAGAAGLAPAAGAPAVAELVTAIRSKDDQVRGEAWQGAGQYGAPAVRPLAAVMGDADFEIARAAKRGLWKIVHHAGRPGATKEARAVEAELLAVLQSKPPRAVGREVAWMLSEIGGDAAVGVVAALLGDAELREDARMVLQRIPGRKSLTALRTGLKSASAEFKPHLAESLRKRGETISDYPTPKLVPTKPTTLKPV